MRDSIKRPAVLRDSRKKESKIVREGVVDVLITDCQVYGNERGEVIMRELPFLELRKVYIVSVGSPVLSIVVSKDKKFLLCGCSDGHISILTDPSMARSIATVMKSASSDSQISA